VLCVSDCRYGGGRVGLSDTMTGAFWVADALFAFANAGARAFHLHWGKGGEPSGNSQPNTGVQTNFDKVGGHAISDAGLVPLIPC